MNKRMLKAQSAMEYLMTYGWAILIIAVVLGALFSLGVFNPTLGTACIPSSGYLCTIAAYSHTTGNVLITVGQNSGSNWGSVVILFAPQGTSMTTNGPLNSGTNVISTGLTSGQTTQINLPVSAAVTVGTAVAGSIWACYTGSGVTGTITYTGSTGACALGVNTIYYAQMGTLTAKAS